MTIGGFDLALVPPAFVVKDVAIANDPRGLAGPCFAAEEVSLRGIPQIVARRASTFRRCGSSARASSSRSSPTGRTTSPRSWRPCRRGAAAGRTCGSREAVLQKGTFRFREWKAKLDVILSDAALTARSGRFSRTTRASLGCRRARFKLDDGDVLDFELGADLVLSPGRVHFRGIRLRGDGLVGRRARAGSTT